MKFKRVKDALWLRACLAATFIAANNAYAAADTEVVARPLKLVNYLMFVIMAIFYVFIGLMWLWFPVVVIWMVYKHYNKKATQGQDDVSGDMTKAMGFAGFIAVVISFVTIGFLGNLFFGQGQNSDLVTGIQSYYGNFMTNIRNSIQQNAQP